MKKAVLGCAVLLVFGFMVAGCINSTSGGGSTGTAPTITSAIVATNETNADNWNSASSFAKGVDIWVGVEVSDPDADIVIAGFTLKKDGTPYLDYRNTGFNRSISTSYFKGCAFGVNISTWGLDVSQLNAMVGSGYVVDAFFIDAKGNKSNVVSSNSFSITS